MNMLYAIGEDLLHSSYEQSKLVCLVNVTVLPCDTKHLCWCFPP